jgi:hypothetical protein
MLTEGAEGAATETTDLTIGALKEMRQDIRDLGARVDGTNARLDTVCDEVHETREELSRRIVESEVRASTAIAELAGTVREMTGVLGAANDLRPRSERREHDIEETTRRVG